MNKQARRETRSILDEMKLALEKWGVDRREISPGVNVSSLQLIRSDLNRLCEAHACIQDMECVRDTYQKKLEALCTHNEVLKFFVDTEETLKC